MVGIHILVQIVVYVDFGARQDNAFYLGKQFVERKPFGNRNVVERDFAVYALDDKYFKARFIDHRLDDKILRTFNLVFFYILFDQIDKRLTVFLCLAYAHPRDMGHFFHRDGVLNGHVFQRRLLKYNVWRQFFFLRNIFEQIFEHAEQYTIHRFAALTAALAFEHFFGVFIVVVVFRNPDFVGLRHKGATLVGEFENTVVLNFFLHQVFYQTLPAHGFPIGIVFAFALAKHGQKMMFALLYIGAGLAHGNVDEMVHFELRLGFFHQSQEIAHVFGGIHPFSRMAAVVAVAAVLVGIVFAKVVQNVFAAAHARFGIRHGFGHELLGHFLFGHGLIFEKFLQLHDVVLGIEGNATPFAAVATRPAGFLIVALNALGHIVVNHKTHIGLVNPHAKGNGGHNHVYFFHQEFVLIFGAGLRIQPGVIGQGFNAVGAQNLRKLFHFFAAQTIDNARF